MNENKTRKEIIDQRLQAAGWNVTDVTQVIQEFDIEVTPTYKAAEPSEYYGHQFSDYVLLDRNRKALAVVEAKKTSVDARKGEEQAKQYAHNIQKQFDGDLPFCFYTNGHDIYFWDLGNYPPRKVYGFPTLADLERWVHIRKNRGHLGEEIINTGIAGRPYQIQAIRTVMEGVEARKRKFLLVMATGTGKTRTTIAFIDALIRANWASRVLFLVDRIALRNQTVDEFGDHTPNYSVWPHPSETSFDQKRRVYVSTYQTMLNIIENEKTSISPHFFDLIIVDESHRSIYNVYQGILNYFNAIVLGLTATPTDVIDHNTFEVFECENGLPSFAYTFEEAVNNIPKYLNNFQVLALGTKFQKEGIHKSNISVEEQKKLIVQGIDPEEINFQGTELEKAVTNKGTNALVVKEFMEECIKDSNGVLPGKTIFFCMTMAHARRVKEVFDQFYPQFHGELTKVIVSDDPRVYGKGGLLDQFRNNDLPRIAISVDMLDTGIDVPTIVNLVFAKPVFSYTKFWQMIGRGTRILDPTKVKPWCKEKGDFLIIDCWDNFDYFKLTPKGKELKQQVALPVRLFRMRLEKLRKAQELFQETIATKETQRLKGMLDLLALNNVVIMDEMSLLKKVKDEMFWERLDEQKFITLEQSVSPLFRTLSGVDFMAMRFEKDLVETSIALMDKDEQALQNLKEIISAQIAELPLSVNIVAKEKDLITKSLRSAFWKDLTELEILDLEKKLAPLMRYRNQNKVPPGTGQVSLNIQDELIKKEYVEFGPKHELVSISRYKEMVEQTIKELSITNLVLQKIKFRAEVTEGEVKRLVELLAEKDPYVTVELLKRVYDNKNAAFLQFIKHILGVEVLSSFTETVSKAFSDFIKDNNTLSSQQIQFLEVLKNFIVERGQITKRDLVNPPFTQIHPNGILGVFQPNQIEKVIELTQKIVA